MLSLSVTSLQEPFSVCLDQCVELDSCLPRLVIRVLRSSALGAFSSVSTVYSTDSKFGSKHRYHFHIALNLKTSLTSPSYGRPIVYDVLEFLIRVQYGRQRTGGRPRKKGQLSPAAEPRAAHQCTEEDGAEEEMAGSERAFDSTKTVSSGRQKSYRIKINVVRNIPICIHNCFQATSKISTTVLDELGLKVFPRCLNSVFQKLDVDVGILARHACYRT